MISNAYKFTIQGGITLRIFENVYFDAGLFERRKSLKFEVSDTGVGIPDKDIPKLFKLFGMINTNQRKLNSKGTGLGLAISKNCWNYIWSQIKIEGDIKVMIITNLLWNSLHILYEEDM